MENGCDVETNTVIKMGATGNPNITRLATLQERKKQIEESLANCNHELKQICLQEADLTGIIPQEMPLEPGESPPLIRRRVGTTYQLPENLIKNSTNKDESVTGLELQIQVHTRMAEAALGLAKEQNISKTLKRQHKAEYDYHKVKFRNLQEKLDAIKTKATQEALHKQKKKPRPTDQDDNVSMSTNIIDIFDKNELRQSIRSNKLNNDGGGDGEQRYVASPYLRQPYKHYSDTFYNRCEDSVSRGLYTLSIDGYKNYMEKQEILTDSGYNTLPYNQHHNQIVQHHLQHYRHSKSHGQLYPPSRSTPTNYSYSQNYIKPIKHSPTQRSQLRQSSPSTNVSHCRIYQDVEQNPHQIQPHQQYEHMTLGLGGYWKRLESGETVWCNSSPLENTHWQRDKRFGSLDRRKNKRIHKRVSPNVDIKLTTLTTYADNVRTAALKSPQSISKRGQDRQLVRTQSLGSVGGQTVDSVWPSDENSSCESDNRSISGAAQGLRKQKQKQWMETSLDGPVSPTHSVIFRSHSALPSVLSPEEKYIATKPPFEIPAESNPSPRIHETNIEMFNNNIMKNCTIVQAGHCKPYHEETKPFEMSDFYKYSTKYKKSPQKHQEEMRKISRESGIVPKNLNETFEKVSFNNNQSFSPMHSSPGQRIDNSNPDISLMPDTHVAEHFSDEMNAWYHKLQMDNNGSGNASKPKSTSTATLV